MIEPKKRHLHPAGVTGEPLYEAAPWGFLIQDQSDPKKFAVALPHKCDEWVISYGDSTKTIEGLAAFITGLEKIQEFLVRLAEDEPYDILGDGGDG